MRALGRIFAADRRFMTCGTMPGWNAVSPPELARYAPVVDVLHPVQVGLRVHFRREPDMTFLHRSDGFVGQRLDLHKPLQRKPRLYDRLAAVAVANIVNVV